MTSVFRRFLRRHLPAVLAALGPYLAAPARAQVAPSNVYCGTAQRIPGDGPFPYQVTLDTTPRWTDAGPSYICNSKQADVGKTVWFTFTPAATDNFQIDTLGSTPATQYDTILGVYVGTCGNLVPLSNGCSDDTVGSLQSIVSLALSGGTTYTIAVSGLGGRDPVFPSQIVPSVGGTLKLNVNRVPVNYPYKYVVPSVAHASGLASYASTVSLVNLESADGFFAMQFLGHGQLGDQSPPTSQPVLNPAPIPAGASRELVDVLGSAFGLTNDYGALLIQSTRRLLAGAVTATSGPAGGTYGQFAPAMDLSTELLATGETGRIIGIRDDANFRTNVALFNATAFQCGVQLEVRDALGQIPPSGARLPVLPPNTMVQINGLRDFLGTDEIRNASLVVTVPVTAASCAVGGVAYVIDRVTNDPYAVPLRK